MAKRRAVASAQARSQSITFEATWLHSSRTNDPPGSTRNRSPSASRPTSTGKLHGAAIGERKLDLAVVNPEAQGRADDKTPLLGAVGASNEAPACKDLATADASGRAVPHRLDNEGDVGLAVDVERFDILRMKGGGLGARFDLGLDALDAKVRKAGPFAPAGQLTRAGRRHGFKAAIVSASIPASFRISSACCPGCGIAPGSGGGASAKRGAAPPCNTPSISRRTPRAFICGSFNASDGAQDRREAYIRAMQKPGPVLARFAPEQVAQTFFQRRPFRLVVLVGEIGIVGEIEPLQQLRVETWAPEGRG